MSIDWTGTTATVAAAIRAAGVETDLADADLVAKASAARQEIAARGYGPGTDVVYRTAGWGQTLLELPQPAAAVTEVLIDGDEILADGDGYRIRPGGRYLERLSGGYVIGWAATEVAITFDAAATDERYDRVVIDLVKLALEYSGLDSRRDGDYGEESMGARGGGGQRNYASEREALIAELGPGWTFA